jgi:hypothetical protein
VLRAIGLNIKTLSGTIQVSPRFSFEISSLFLYNQDMVKKKTKGEKREEKNRKKMRVSGKSVFKIVKIIKTKSK